MNPRLIAIAGPLKGAVFTLTEEEFSIGRDSSNQIAINDQAISRRHCLITQEAGQFKIQDLNSLNSTSVNGVPVKEKFLEHGDRLAISDSSFILLLHEVETPPHSNLIQFDEGAGNAHSTTVRRVEELLPTKDLPISPLTELAAQWARDLHALIKISTTINSLRDPEALQRQLLEMISEVVPAERGAVLLVGDNWEEFTSIFGWDKNSQSDKRSVQVSRAITRQVLNESVAILSNDILESKTFSQAESLITAQVQSLLCVPLMLFEKPLGVVYLATSDPTARFDEGHLQFVTAAASIAAVALENARHLEWLESENKRLQADIGIEHNMVGESQRMQEVYQLIAKVAPTNSTVLIRGESGTGKELAARAIHQNSPRASKAFVALNCAALTETLLESELFGHEKGAFTGAIAQKKGKLEVAEGGTIFLDEIGEMTPLLQAKLLRVLQERQFERVGGTRPLKADVRVIAATNRDLEEAIKNGNFRQDLYYRLNVVSVTMPPLRDRREDIPLLTSHFVVKHSQKANRRVTGISPEARACLISYDWPGNVRELENAIERAIMLGTTNLIRPEDLPDTLLEAEPAVGLSTSVTEYHDAIKETKKQLIRQAVEQAGGNYTEAAKLLGVHPNYLHRLIRNLNLKTGLKKYSATLFMSDEECG